MTSITYSCLSWVPRGAAREQPDSFEGTGVDAKKGLERLADGKLKDMALKGEGGSDDDDGDDAAGASTMADGKDDSAALKAVKKANKSADAKAGGGAKKGAKRVPDPDEDPEITRFMDKLKMEEYDDEDEGIDGAELFMNGPDHHAEHANNKSDPYMDPNAPDDSEDEDNHAVAPTDSLICLGHSEKEEHNLRVYLYDEKTSALFVHHDYTLPAFPLAVQFMDCGPNEEDKGAWCAVGMYGSSTVELWNLDVINNIEPAATLEVAGDATAAGAAAAAGGSAMEKDSKDSKSGGKGGKKKKETQKEAKKKVRDEQPAAVMCFAWSPARRELLAVGYADHKIRIWNVKTRALVHTLSHHTAQVQALEWHPIETNLLISGGYDKQVFITDLRTADKPNRFGVEANVETVRWDPIRPQLFWVSLESGALTCHDARKPGEKLFTLKAHDTATTAMSLNRRLPLLATASVDGTIKLWNLADMSKPSLLVSKPMKVGALFCMAFDHSNPYILAAGGGQDVLAIWDITENSVMDKFVTAGEYARAVQEAKATGKPVPPPPAAPAATAAAAAPIASASGAAAAAAAPKAGAKTGKSKLSAASKPKWAKK